MTAREVLELRQRVRATLRDVFDALGFLEVDTPVLATEVLPEAHIDPVPVSVGGGGTTHYLQASPELLMKRLLAAGSGAIYQFARSFRAGEIGRQHDVEFVLLEWYAPAATLDDTAALLDRLCSATLGTAGIERVSCAEAFATHAGVDPLSAPLAEMQAALGRAAVVAPESIEELPAAEQWDRAFELLLAEVVQPRLGHGRPTMLEDWPRSQAAFARLDPRRPGVARRFELFARGVELANGWEEETDRGALAARIDAANRARIVTGRDALPVPRQLLEAHGPTMPAGVGAALGFDRLTMLVAGADSIDAVRCFTSRSA